MFIFKSPWFRLAVSMVALNPAAILFRANSPISQEPDAKLSKILTECAAYCDKLKSARLNFTCFEEIEERIFHPFITIKIDSFRTYQRERNRYGYDYQLIKDSGMITERRVLISENGRSRHEKDAALKTKRFDYQFVINGPIGVLDKDRQKRFNYKIARNEDFTHGAAIILEAVPKSGFPTDHLFGRIWVNSSDFSIMKIVWNQESLGKYDEIRKTAEHLNAIPDIELISEYSIEKNGIRFPSKYSIEEKYKAGPRILTKSKLSVSYENYRFFTVETSVKYESH